MAVVIRMKPMGRKHRPYYRICATDSRRPVDGAVLEELGTYDPMIKETDARVTFNHDRLQYWLSTGAKPSDKVKVLIKKYGPKGTHVDAQTKARELLSMPKVVPPAGEAVFTYSPKSKDAPAAEAPAESTEAEAPAATEGGE